MHAYALAQAAGPALASTAAASTAPASTGTSHFGWILGYTIGIVIVLVVVALVVPILLLARSIGNEAPKINYEIGRASCRERVW